mgnify:CR=1 FL=1
MKKLVLLIALIFLFSCTNKEQGYNSLEKGLISTLENKDEKEILTRQETANLLGTSLTTLFHWGNLGVLNPTKIGRRVYYTQSELQRYFANVKPLNQ